MLRLCKGLAGNLRNVQHVAPALARTYAVEAFPVPASMHSAVSGDSGRYAIKLYDITAKDNSIDAVSKDLDELAVALPDVKFLNYISVPLPEKLKSLEAEVYKTKKTHPLAKDFVAYLIKQNQLKLLPRVASDFHKVVAFARNEMVVTLTSAAPVPPKSLDEIKKSIMSKCPPGKKLIIKQKIDPTILGGYIAECNNTVLDSSIKSKLQKVDTIIQSPAFKPVLQEVFDLP